MPPVEVHDPEASHVSTKPGLGWLPQNDSRQQKPPWQLKVQSVLAEHALPASGGGGMVEGAAGAAHLPAAVQVPRTTGANPGVEKENPSHTQLASVVHAEPALGANPLVHAPGVEEHTHELPPQDTEPVAELSLAAMVDVAEMQYVRSLTPEPIRHSTDSAPASVTAAAASTMEA